MPDSGSTILGLFVQLSNIATPFVLIAVGWYIKNRIEASQRAAEDRRKREQRIEEEIRSDRLQIYNDVLEPFVVLLWNEDAVPNKTRQQRKSRHELAIEKLLSLEYRQSAFKLPLFANDDVVRAYNSLMQLFYSMDGSSASTTSDDLSETTVQAIAALGHLLLEIRKSVGNEATSLSNLEMLEWMIKDIRRLNII